MIQVNLSNWSIHHVHLIVSAMKNNSQLDPNLINWAQLTATEMVIPHFIRQFKLESINNWHLC